MQKLKRICVVGLVMAAFGHIDLRMLTKKNDHVAQLQELYGEACKRFSVNPDIAVHICLQTGSEFFRSTRRYTDSDLLPLCVLVQKMQEINNPCSPSFKGLSFKNGDISSNGALLLANVLATDKQIKLLDLSENKIGTRGFIALADALRENTTLLHLDMHSNKCGFYGAQYLARALESSAHCLVDLNMADTSIGFEGVRLMSAAVKVFNDGVKKLNHNKTTIKKNYLNVNLLTNFVREEVLNSITHGLGLILSIIGTIILLVSYSDQVNSLYGFAGGIFCFSMIAVYLNSFCYHTFFKFPLVKKLFHRLDKLSIYFLIAGTYTPYSLIALHGNVGWALCGFVWALAVIGVYLDFAYWGQFDNIKLVLYVTMGWSAVTVVVPVITHPTLPLSMFGALFLLLGGISYTGGVYFFVKDSEIPLYHSYWHVFVVLGTVCHWLSIYYSVMTIPTDGPRYDHFIFSP
ncbi:monocyte to macrophage differentiation protein [Pelomyxa schiedti]|nr:monocyte to macrophage differentiation protein [Pelomyxa schiedti]